MDGLASNNEQLDDRRNRARMLVQRGKECLRWEQTPFGKRYLKRNLKIGLRRIDFGPPYYGVILEARLLFGFALGFIAVPAWGQESLLDVALKRDKLIVATY